MPKVTKRQSPDDIAKEREKQKQDALKAEKRERISAMCLVGYLSSGVKTAISNIVKDSVSAADELIKQLEE